MANKKSNLENFKFYSNLISSIYKENLNANELNRSSLAKPTDPILHSYEPEMKSKIKGNTTPLNNSYLINSNGPTPNIKPDQLKCNKISYSKDILKSSYSVFYEHDKDYKNYRASNEMTRYKKTSKKLFTDKKNETNIESVEKINNKLNKRETKKKNFHQSKNLNISSNIIFTDMSIYDCKEHLKTNSGSVYASKKHYKTNSVLPSNYTQWINDRKKLLPVEMSEKYKKQYENTNKKRIQGLTHKETTPKNSTYSHYKKINNPNLTENNNLIVCNRRKYPYVKDTIKNVLYTQSNMINKKEQKYANKINLNPFDLLKRVTKYEWEK